MLSPEARAVIGDEHPVVFAATQLGFESVLEFLEDAGKGQVRAEVIESYANAVAEKGAIPFFAVEPIEKACMLVSDKYSRLKDSCSNPPTERPPDKGRRKRRKQHERRYAVSRRKH